MVDGTTARDAPYDIHMVPLTCLEIDFFMETLEVPNG